MSGHTPGEWRVGIGGNLHANRVWTTNERPIVNLCSMGTSPADIDTEAQANGRLIAAAPELLEALQHILEGLELRGLLDGWHHDTQMVERARRAVAKATGDSQ